jgi:uncharacterized protein (TIGR02271 family)
MTAPGVVMVTSQDGVRGTIDTTAWPLDGSKAEVLVRLESGQRVLVPREALIQQGEGHYALSVDLANLAQQYAENTLQRQTQVLPVIVEELDVQKRSHETGRVRITKRVHEQEELVDEPLLRDEVVIEHVPINRFVEGPVSTRSEGDTVIIPLLEEVLVVEKRLLLKEELHLTKRRVETHQPQRVTLRREEAAIERAETEPHEDNRPLEEKGYGEDRHRTV